MSLSGKTVLISGAAQGLGAAMARRFAEAGAAVFIGDLNDGAGNTTAAAIRALDGEYFKSEFVLTTCGFGSLFLFMLLTGIHL